jgi:heme/copper-type cytochrome/quinol oxidase subunit 1
MSGAILATAIRLEMAYPGSPFFGGDSLRYLQVITAHALIMIFFVVVPIFFGGFANFLLPYHVGSKDVAFPRLNSLGFWIQPCGYLLIAKIGFTRTVYWTNYEKIDNYYKLKSADHFSKSWTKNQVDFKIKPLEHNYHVENISSFEKDMNILNFFKTDFESSTLPFSEVSWKLTLWKYIHVIPDSFHFLITNAKKVKRQKRHVVKCASATQTVSGWTFITPFSSKVKYTGVGIQDMLILGVYFAGISTTISLVNLLATRRTLAIPGLRNRRILLPFISITILLMLRALAVITPVLGSAMLMLALDRHWQTSFFDFAYGGDPIFFHHLFWFFGHPEVYVLVIPAFGVINSVLPAINFRRVASKHHLVWAIYIMNYMGFLVWGHHMYLIGLDHRSRALYSTITIMISMPATIKVVNWTYTLVNGFLNNNLIFLAVTSFIMFFLVAGFTGMWLSHVSLNISMHDTLYVVAHFHLMLSGAVIMSIFVGFYFYFPAFFQVKYSRTFGYLHIILYTGGHWLVFLPLFWVSFSGLPRRLHDFPAIYMGWQSMSTTGHFITMIGVLGFYFMILDSKLEKKFTIYLMTLVARFNKRANYYIGKFISFYIIKNSYKFVPVWKAQVLAHNL